ncbi:MAG: hypothetical protein AAF108_02715 [Planctomycetota bacterium]
MHAGSPDMPIQPVTVASPARAAAATSALPVGIVSLLAIAILFSGSGRSVEMLGPEVSRSVSGPRTVETSERVESRVIAEKPRHLGPGSRVTALLASASRSHACDSGGAFGVELPFNLLALPPPVCG